MTIDIINLGPGTATVAAGTGGTDDDVEYVLVGGNKIQVKAATNNLAAITYNATITIPRGMWHLTTPLTSTSQRPLMS